MCKNVPMYVLGLARHPCTPPVHAVTLLCAGKAPTVPAAFVRLTQWKWRWQLVLCRPWLVSESNRQMRAHLARLSCRCFASVAVWHRHGGGGGGGGGSSEKVNWMEQQLEKQRQAQEILQELERNPDSYVQGFRRASASAARALCPVPRYLRRMWAVPHH